MEPFYHYDRMVLLIWITTSMPADGSYFSRRGDGTMNGLKETNGGQAMFCSKCGRTLALEDQQCPHCGNPVGESRFEGTPYTSAQAQILPNAPVKQATAAFTRTTYTTMTEEQQQEGSVDSRTTYRPVYSGASVPEDVRRDMRATMKGAEEQPGTEEAEDLAPAA